MSSAGEVFEGWRSGASMALSLSLLFKWWSGVAPGGSRRLQETPGGPKSFQEVHSGLKSELIVQIVALSRSRRFQEAPGSPMRLQERPGTSSKLVVALSLKLLSQYAAARDPITSAKNPITAAKS